MAAERILNHLSAAPKAQTMAAEVLAFYSKSLLYQETSLLPSSFFEIRLRHSPIGLECARIGLRLGTERTAEALSHELLHLRLGMLGYPMGELVRIARQMLPYADYLMGLQGAVCNLLHHELIFSTFLNLGFTEDRFLAQTLAPDYEAVASKLLCFSNYPVELVFPWWCVEYLGQWLSLRHGYEGQSGGNGTDIIRCASRLCQEIVRATDEMRTIIESGALGDVGKHAYWTNRLLTLMKLPGYIRWASLIAGSQGSPTAVKSDLPEQSFGKSMKWQ